MILFNTKRGLIIIWIVLCSKNAKSFKCHIIVTIDSLKMIGRSRKYAH